MFEIGIQLRKEHEAVVLGLRDNGLGFSKTEIEQTGAAFAHFDRPGATTGTGLGLAISTALAQRMHGAVQIRSAQGEGTLAELRLPLPSLP